jgi:hypothetical protein
MGGGGETDGLSHCVGMTHDSATPQDSMCVSFSDSESDSESFRMSADAWQHHPARQSVPCSSTLKFLRVRVDEEPLHLVLTYATVGRGHRYERGGVGVGERDNALPSTRS